MYYLLIPFTYVALLWPASRFIGMFLYDGFDFRNRKLLLFLVLYPIVVPVMLVTWGIEETRKFAARVNRRQDDDG